MSPSGNFTGRIHRRIRAFNARGRYRLGLPFPDPPEARPSPTFKHPVDARQKSALTALYRERFPETVSNELAECDRLIAHDFALLGHRVTHDERIAWWRDPVSGRDWPGGFSPDIVYRGEGRLGDIKLPWELSKHQYFFTLGKASWLTGDTAPVLEIVRQIDDWIETNPYQTGINWISALEAGARVSSWILAFPFFAGSCDEELLRRLTRSLSQHCLFVEQHLSRGRFNNTHLVGEAAALVAGALFLQCSRSRKWLELGLEILEEEVARQVTADGMHAERSVAYHRFFLDQYFLVSALLSANGRTFSAKTLARLEQMTAFLGNVLFPDGMAPTFGDGDDARGLWFHADSPKEYRGILSIGAMLFGRGDFKAAAGRLHEEVLWLYGAAGVESHDRLPATASRSASVAYPDAGYYVMRGKSTSSESVLMFDCGALGYGPAGHGHADALSIQLFTEGYSFLVDPGTFSYNLDYRWRDAFRTTRAHNTVVVDGQEQSVPRDRMSWSTTAECHCHSWTETPWFDVVDGEHDGYRRLSDAVTHRRIVVFLKPDIWILWDLCGGQQRHEFDLLMHVQPDCRVELTSEAAVLVSPTGVRLNVWISGENDCENNVSVITGDENERAAWFSPEYGVRIPSRAISVRHALAGLGGFVTCLSTLPLRPRITWHSRMIDIVVDRGERGEERLRYVPDPHDLVNSDDCRFDGRLLFTRRQSDRSPLVCATSFRELAIEGLIQVRAPEQVERLTLENDRCQVLRRTGRERELQFKGPDGVRIVEI